MPLWKQNEKSLQALFFLHVNAALMLQMANKYPSGIGGGGWKGGAAVYFEET